MHRMLLSTLVLAVLALAAPNGAQALTLNVVGGSVGEASYCADTLCFSEPLSFDTGDAVTFSGTITVDGGNVSFDIDVSVIGFSGGPDGAVSDVELQSLSYVAGPVAFSGTADDFIAGGTAAVTGTVSPDAGAGSAIDLPTAAFSMTCLDESSQLKCGIVLAGLTFPISVDGSTRYVPHTLNPTAVPEPHPMVMALTAGLLALTYGRTRSRKATH